MFPRRSTVKFNSALATAFAVALIPAASSAADMARTNIVNVGRMGCGIVATM